MPLNNNDIPVNEHAIRNGEEAVGWIVIYGIYFQNEEDDPAPIRHAQDSWQVCSNKIYPTKEAAIMAARSINETYKPLVKALRAALPNNNDIPIDDAEYEVFKKVLDTIVENNNSRFVKRPEPIPAEKELLEVKKLLNHSSELLAEVGQRHRDEVAKLRAQLTEGMDHCTIQFKSCEKGHGRLLASNWIDNGCKQCHLELLREELAEANKSNPKPLPKCLQGDGCYPFDAHRIRNWERLAKITDEVAVAMLGGTITNKEFRIIPSSDTDYEYQCWCETDREGSTLDKKFYPKALAVYKHDFTWWLIRRV